MLGWLRAIIGPPDASRTRVRLEERVQELQDRDRERESDMKSLRLEWEETYESVNRALRKMGKREKRAGKDGDCGCHEAGEGDPAGSDAANGRTPNYMAIARQRYGNPWGAR